LKRAVLVGCGVMGAGWVKAIVGPRLSSRVAVAGLVDVEPGAAEKLRDAFCLPDVAIGTDLDAMLSEAKPDLVFDVAVPASRRDIVLTALRHGCHVLTEKPMAASLEDAREINAAARSTGLVHAVTQNRRFKRSIRRIRAALHDGLIGEVNALHCDFFVGAHFGGFRDEMEHVLLLDMAIHTFDAARFMSGRDAEAVYCLETNPAGSWYAHGAAANAIFELADDVVFTYRGSWAAEGANTSWEATWRIIGTKGTLLWDGEDAVTAKLVDGDQGFFRPLRDAAVPEWPDEATTREHESVIADFLDALESGRAPESTGTDNIKSLAMVFGAIDSASTQRRTLISSRVGP
jgi:predicted dehydrogenase